MPQVPAPEPGKQQRPGFATAAGPKQLVEQLAAKLGQTAESGVDARLAELEAKLDNLSSRLATPASAPAPLPVAEDALGDKLKKLISSVLLQSGFLEKFVAATVERKLEEAGAKDLRAEASRIVKEFLAENLTTVFEKEMRAVVQKEVEACLAGDGMKELLDEKFRTVTLFLKTDVIPNAVRQALKNPVTQRA